MEPMFRFVCAHQRAGNLFVVGKLNDGEGPLVLWTRPVSKSTREEAESVGRLFAAQYGCPFGCTDPWELKHSGPDVKPEGNTSNDH